MPLLTEGSPAPAFSVPNQDGATVSLDQFAGKWVVLCGIRKPTHRAEPGKAKGSVIDPTTSRQGTP